MASTDARRIEEMLVSKKDWKYTGEVRASARPKNSLLDVEVDFDTTLLNIALTPDQNSEVAKYIALRFRERTFDNYEFKKVREKPDVETYSIEECATDKEILALYESIEKELWKITDLGNDGFL
jgi:U3 small nucleolar ribonucleoprotein component